MANHQQQSTLDSTAITRLQGWADSNHGEGNGAVVGEVACGGRERPTRVEPDSHEEHMSAMFVAPVNSSSSGATKYGNAEGLTTAVGLPAVPVSPPASPLEISAQQEAVMNNPELESSLASMENTVEFPEAAPPIAKAGPESNLKTEANQSAVKVQQSPVGGGAHAAPPAVKIPLLSATSDGGKDLVKSNAKASAGAGTPSAPLRLGRGRKQCPSCKATTKSAVKQCRECKHIFSPASSRLRAPPREPKENADEPMPARRRLRPSQRLIEYELYEGSGADEGNRLLTARRPSNTSNGGGSANRSVDSSASGGRPAVSYIEGSKKLASSGGVDGPANPPKRSHKRKVPLPSGVSQPRRKKGSAAAAKAAANASAETAINEAERADRASTGNAYKLLPFISLPERQEVAQHLVATSTPMVPTSPELLPAATPAGPLLFMPSNATLDDDSGWLSAPVSMTPLTVQLPQQSVGCRAGQANQRLAPEATDAPFEVSVEDLLISSGKGEKSEPSKRLEDVIDTSVESQAKDPFEGVQLLLEGSSAGGNDRSLCGYATNAGAATMAHGAATEFSQRMLSNNGMDLLGDGEVDLMWSPMRTSVNDSIGSLAPSISNTSLWSDGSISSRSGSDLVFPNFERGAALASTVALNGGGIDNFETELTGSESIGDLHGLLLGDPNLESLTDVCRH